MPHFSPIRRPLGLLVALFATMLVALGTPVRAVEADGIPSVRGGDRGGVHAGSQRDDYRASTHTVFAREGAATTTEVDADAGATLPLASKRLPAPINGESSPKASGWSTLFSALGSLAVVLGLFLAVVWFLRRTSPKMMAALPGEVFEVLGRSPLAARQQAQLVRCGNKLLLLSVTAGGAETLTEITDPAEVERLLGLCQQARPNSATASFRNLFSQFGGESSSVRPAARATRFGLGRLPRSGTEVADV
jgi:flagellar biogenesis protein FliO